MVIFSSLTNGSTAVDLTSAIDQSTGHSTNKTILSRFDASNCYWNFDVIL